MSKFVPPAILPQSAKYDEGVKAIRQLSLKIGDVVQEGPDKGWIFCKSASGEAFLVAPADSGVMQWRDAMEFAASEKAKLPTREQLEAVYEARGIGAFSKTFNLTGSDTSGWYWTDSPNPYGGAWCQRFSDGVRTALTTKKNISSIRCIRTC